MCEIDTVLRWHGELQYTLGNASGADPLAHQEDCEMHEAKLTVSPRGGIISCDKVPWSDLSLQ